MDKIVGITAGSFDLGPHAGHVLMFEECKKECNHLIVCLQTDPTKDRKEKNKPVQNITERYLQLRACKFVDEIILYETEQELYSILSSVSFNKRFIGEDWKGKNYTGHDIPGMSSKIVWNTRKHDFSSSALRDKVYYAEKIKHQEQPIARPSSR